MSKVEKFVEESDNLAAGLQLEYYSLDIKFCKLMGIDFSEKVH